ncbi:protein kinase domain-containing protein [Caenimonas aquaedulcis]|uniref:Protein kinase n=1 Tax=Caenimonas aquaedulcis TaxID=2793270 RepID=A0A931H775_9BURK|nr:protein kinase [Caenimonas aquaedulcis]MBG9389949.1 protein kinase [Caenimonas aquaedulcis]
MTQILVVEDDDAIRNNIIRLLKLEGFEIASAINGREGLEQVRRARPDIVISDVSMPEMDGFEMLEAIRADRELAATSVMLLTALDDRASMRRGMTAGADDYLAKPFTRVELLDALQGLMKKKGRIEHSIESAVKAREDYLRQAFTESMGGRDAPAGRFDLGAPQGAVADQVLGATVLFADIRGFTSLAEKLDSREVAELLTQYFERVCDPVLKNGGRHLKFIGDGMMAVFADTLSGGSPLPAARRAISAALGMALATHEFRAWIDRRFDQRGLPPFAIGVGLHAGEVTICRLGTIQNKETTPIGETVNVAARLESASKELGWTVVASSAVMSEAGEGIQTGGMTSLAVRANNGYVDVAEIIGLVTNLDDKRHGMATLTERADEVRDAVQVNSEITARAVKGALQSKLSAFKEHQFEAGQEPPRLKGYRLSRKIGAGGMTEVYLAVRESDGLPVVLKVLDASGKGVSEHLSRFIQEYTLLSRIDHPNVIRIYDQGFTDDHAYIAMEYFEQGDLRAEITAGMSQQRVLAIVTQVAQALDAIHARGIIHRDLKPENIMRREGGRISLADFGIAKSMLQAENMALTQTRHGDVVGTPYYLSPEQAAGHPIGPQSDLYSLGVMMFEMLVGHRPFRAESLNLLLAHHISAPTPALPQAHASLQPVVERLMAKDPGARYATPAELLADLDQRALLQTVTGPGG